MLATRRDQENAVTSQHASHFKEAALQTPAQKTNRSIARRGHDENAADRAKSAAGKTKQTDPSTFVTPVGPRTRAPLGAKTTNAKVVAFKTPLQPTTHKPSRLSSTKQSKRAQFKVHSGLQAPEAEERDVEYMPPRGEPLLDLPDPDIWPHDRTYPQFEGDNFLRGWTAGLAVLDEHVDYEQQYRRLEEQESVRGQSQTRAKDGTIEQTQFGSAPVQPRPKGGFASATSSSMARAKDRVGKGREADVPRKQSRNVQGPSTRQRAHTDFRAASAPMTTSATMPVGQVSVNTRQPQSRPQIPSMGDCEDNVMQHFLTRDLLELEGLEGFQLDMPGD